MHKLKAALVFSLMVLAVIAVVKVVRGYLPAAVQPYLPA